MCAWHTVLWAQCDLSLSLSCTWLVATFVLSLASVLGLTDECCTRTRTRDTALLREIELSYNTAIEELPANLEELVGSLGFSV